MAKSVILVSVILIAAVGCTVLNTNRFRVVDASGGRPIAGVRAEGDISFPTSCFHIQQLGPFHAKSDGAGLIRFDEMGVEKVTFTKRGYKPCTIVSGWPGYRRCPKLFNLRSLQWEDDYTPVVELQPRTE